MEFYGYIVLAVIVLTGLAGSLGVLRALHQHSKSDQPIIDNERRRVDPSGASQSRHFGNIYGESHEQRERELQYLCGETGEIVHSIGNMLVDRSAVIGKLSEMDGRILQELGQALRSSLLVPGGSAHLYPTLISHGFDPVKVEKTVIAGIASRIIGNGGLIGFEEAIELELGGSQYLAKI